MKLVINRCYGGFGLSDKAYEKLIEWGIPVRAYVEEVRDPETGLFKRAPENEGQIIFDSYLDSKRRPHILGGRYWDCWIRDDNTRAHPLVVRVVEELGRAASGRLADLAVVEIPDGIEWEISDYDGIETVEEKHRSWP